jgi:hypothetical protein
MNYIDIRSFLAANVENLLENLNLHRQVKKIQTDDLFGAQTSENSPCLNLKLDFKLYSKREILLMEKDSLGLYVSGNPLEDYAPILAWVRDITNRDDVHLMLVNKGKRIFTKAGGMMFALQISTPDEELEGIIFPNKALLFSPKLEEKEIYWVKGKINRPKTKLAREEVSKQAVKDMEEEISEPKETEQEIQEFVELPKLLIEELNRFEEGVLDLFAGEEIKMTIHRIHQLEGIDWSKLKDEPQYLQSILELKNQESKNRGKTTATTPPTPQTETQDFWDNHASSQIKNSIPNLDQNSPNGANLQTEANPFHPINLTTKTNLTNQTDSVVQLKLPKSIGTIKLKEIKASLKKEPSPGLRAVQLHIETEQGFRKVKGTFWVEEKVLKMVS